MNPDCTATLEHSSDCAIHNAPAFPDGPCDCGALPPSEAVRMAQKPAPFFVLDDHPPGMTEAQFTGRPPMPTSIRVGYRTFTVSEMDKLEHAKTGSWGTTSLTDGKVCIHLLGNPEEDGNTLLHEVLHCCYRTMDIQDEDGEERTVTKLANAMSQVWQDNPELIAFLDAALGKSDD